MNIKEVADISDVADTNQTFIFSDGTELKPGDLCLILGLTSRWERAIYLGGVTGLQAHNQGIFQYKKSGEIIRRGRRWVKI